MGGDDHMGADECKGDQKIWKNIFWKQIQILKDVDCTPIHYWAGTALLRIPWDSKPNLYPLSQVEVKVAKQQFKELSWCHLYYSNRSYLSIKR